MGEAKVITALALTVVMLVAMTGIAAAATGFTIDPSEFTIADDGGTADVTVTWNDDQSRVMVANWSVDKWTGSSWITSSGEVLARNGTDAFASNGTQTFSAGQSFIYGVKDAGPAQVGETYRIAFVNTVGSPSPYSEERAFSVTSYGGVDPIPEFATIALPVAAILGLFMFFNRRKRKEE